MGSSLNSGPVLGPKYGANPFPKDPKRDPILENYPYAKIWEGRAFRLRRRADYTGQSPNDADLRRVFLFVCVFIFSV